MAFVPSEGQRDILNLLCSGKSFRVICHAGTGKTTSCLQALAVNREKATLFLEYNRDLKEEARVAASDLQLSNVEVQNYDSLVCHYYDPTAPAFDFQLALERVLERDAALLAPLCFDLLIVDEAQDMTDSFYRLIGKIMRDNLRGRPPQLVLVGDPKQTIYGYRGADSRLMMDPSKWSVDVSTVVTLHQTYRFGGVICKAINQTCRGLFDCREWMRDIEEARDVSAGVALFQASEDSDFSELIRLYRGEISISTDCAVLAYSVQESHALLWNFLEQAHGAGAPKISLENQGPYLRTIHTSKGRQFRSVFVFLTPGKAWHNGRRLREEMRALLYVALSRARERLFVIQETFIVEGHAVCLPPKTAEGQTLFLRKPVQACDELLQRRLSASQKEKLLTQIQHGVPEKLDPELYGVTRVTGLGRLAVELRAEYAKTGNVSRMAPLMEWIAVPARPSLDTTYQLLFLGGRHVLLPDTRAVIEAFSPDVTSWSWDDWHSLALLSPLFHFGHVRTSPRGHTNDELDRLFMNFMLTAQRHHVRSSVNWTLSSKTGLRATDCVVLRCGFDWTIAVFAETETLRLTEVLAAYALFALARDCSEVRIVYLQSCVAIRARIDRPCRESILGVLGG